MEDIVSRIIQIRKLRGESQDKFASQLGLSRNFINQFENRKKNLSERTIKDICDKFNVNEEWLRNGNGEMFLPANRNADIARLTKKLLNEESDSFKNRFISMLSNLSVEEWEFLENKTKELCGLDDNNDK